MHHPRQNSPYHGHCYTSNGELSGMRNSSIGPPWRIDPTTHHTMSECSYHGATFRPTEGSIHQPIAPWANAVRLSYFPHPLTRAELTSQPDFLTTCSRQQSNGNHIILLIKHLQFVSFGSLAKSYPASNRVGGDHRLVIIESTDRAQYHSFAYFPLNIGVNGRIKIITS